MVRLRRRALVFAGLFLVLVFLGVLLFQHEQQRQLALIGTTVKVLVAARPLNAGVPLAAVDLAWKEAPAKYADLGYVTSAEEAKGKRLVASVPGGALIPRYLLTDAPMPEPNEREWELRQSETVLLDSRLQPGDRADVMTAVTASGREGVRTVVRDVRVLTVRMDGKQHVVTIAVQPSDATALMEAENFARQVRLVRTVPLASVRKENAP